MSEAQSSYWNSKALMNQYVMKVHWLYRVVSKLRKKKTKVRSYLRGVPSSWGWITTTLTLTDVRSRSIICSWVRVATATLQISTSRLPCLSPAFQAKPNGSTSATIPSKLTWNPSCPRLLRRRVISIVSQPLVVIWNQKIIINSNIRLILFWLIWWCMIQGCEHSRKQSCDKQEETGSWLILMLLSFLH